MHNTLTKFRYPETLVKEYEHWVALVRYDHVTIGSMVLVNKSEATQLGDLAAIEWEEFAIVTHEIEELLKRTFGAEKFNYFALMMKDPHVHFHLIPRYSKVVSFNDRDYVDADWPLKSLMKPITLSNQELKNIQSVLVESMNSK